MNDEHKEKIYYIQQQADELSAEISKLMRKDFRLITIGNRLLSAIQ